MRSICFLLFIAFTTSLTGQRASEKMRQAKEFIYHSKYDRALAVLTSSKQLSRQDKEGRFLIAVCHYQLNNLEQALATLTQQVEDEKSPYPETWLYLGKIYHAQNRFDEASRYYKLYLKTIRPDHPHRQMVREEIRRAANGLELQFHEKLAEVENMGPGVNTEGDEFAPVLSPNYFDRIYFSSIRQGNTGGPRNKYGQPDDRLGKYYSDIYSCQYTNTGWGATAPMHYLLNSPKHEILLDFNAEGNVLFYFKGWSMNNGDVVIDTFKTVENRTLSSTPFQSQFNPSLDDESMFLYNDTLMIFASRRAGGYGGLDLYRSSLVNGRWTPAENLGPEINSPFDETTPFLARDGITLYFSSNNSRKSIGGFDIFKSVYSQRTRRWSSSFNLGIPINSSANDTHYRISKDGVSAFFASSRKEGFGKRDLYVAHFEDFLPEMEPPAIAYDSPPVMPETPFVPNTSPPSPVNTGDNDFGEIGILDQTPIPESTVVLTHPRVPEASSVSYPSLNLNNPAEVISKGQTTLDQIVQTLSQNPDLQLVITAYSHGNNSLATRLFEAINATEKAGHYLLQKGVSAQQIFMRALDAKTMSNAPLTIEYGFTHTQNLPDPTSVPVIGKNYSSSFNQMNTNQPLCYKVQIASAKNVYNNPALSTFPDAMVEKVPDFAYYRYTLGAFTTYADAYNFRKKVLASGFSGAYIVPYIHGQRADKKEIRQYTNDFPDLRKYLGD